MVMKTYKGSCHCGCITYEADIDLARGTDKCNCTFCRKARSWKAFVRPATFRLLSGREKAKGYHKRPDATLKYFCEDCGMRTHELGSSDYMGGDFVGIFLATLDDVEPEELIRRQCATLMAATTTGENPPQSAPLVTGSPCRQPRWLYRSRYQQTAIPQSDF